jgi:hypothetical protein
MIQFVLRHFAAQGIAVNPQHLRSSTLVPISAFEYASDEAFFEFPNGFRKQNSALHHLSHEAFQLISHVRTLRNRKLS